MTENIIDGYRNITAENISFKRCELSDFGKNYQNILSNKNLSNMLFPINIYYVLEGYYTMEKYSYIVLNYKRCVNSTENNNHCYPMETIEKYLTITNMDTKIQDIELTPQDYDNPVQHLERDLSGKGFKGFQPSILVEMKIVMIETDDNIVGFEGLTKTRIDKYLKYDSALLTPNPSTNDDSNNIAINLNEIIIRLSPSALYQKRTYVQLVDVLGDVGGLMEFVNMLFGGICYFIVDILYNKSLVNNLFNFDISKKNVILKNKNNSKIIDIDNKNVLSKNNNEKKENFQIKRYKRKINIIKDFYTPKLIRAFNEGNNKSSKLNFNSFDIKKINYINYANTIIEDKIDKKNEKENIIDKYQLNHSDDDKESKKNIIRKISSCKLFIQIFFCWFENKQNLNKILFDERMKFIIEQLDIFNVFRRLYELSKWDLNLSEEIIKGEMSDECKLKLEWILKGRLSS